MLKNITNIGKTLVSAPIELTNTAVQGTSNLAKTGLSGTLNLANKGVGASLDLTTNTVVSTLKTIDVTQNAANKITRNIVNVGSKTINSASKLAIEGAKTTEKIGKTGLQLANTAVSTGADISTSGLEQTKSIMTEALETTGKLTTTTLSLTKNSLYNLLGTVNNVLSNNSASIEASKQSSNITNQEYIYTKLRNSIQQSFNSKISSFITNLNTFVYQQQKLMNSVIKVYKMKNCVPGSLYGFTCDSSKNMKINNLKNDLNSLVERNKSDNYRLKTLTNMVSSKIMQVSSFNTSPEEYSTKIKYVLEPLYLEASTIFEESLERFNNLYGSFNLQDQEPVQQMMTEQQPIGGKNKKPNTSKKTKTTNKKKTSKKTKTTNKKKTSKTSKKTKTSKTSKKTKTKTSKISKKTKTTNQKKANKKINKKG